MCMGNARAVSEEVDGYIVGYRFRVLECRDCKTRFSDRLDVPAWLYDSIYANAGHIPGYYRYRHYARRIRKVASPLDFLASAEAPYWHARKLAEGLGQGRQQLIVELGCGEGYLTYALNSAGYRCIGVDISQVAVDLARERFDQPKWFMTTNEFLISEEKAQLVVALELIEHVPDPVALVRDALSYASPGGRVLITTPNRDAAHPAIVWEGDVPPVHLFWFGEPSLVALADRVDASIDFVSRRFPAPQARTNGSGLATLPVLTAEGSPLPRYGRSDLLFWVRAGISARLGRLNQRIDPTPRRSIAHPNGKTFFVDDTLAALLRSCSDQPPES